jgi:phosphoadenosine phosphosulfate reductase
MTICLETTRVARTRALRSASDLRHLAAAGGAALEGASAEEIVAWAAAVFGSRLAVTSSMTDAVVAHLTSSARPGVDVLFLDTGYHFAETIETRDAVSAQLPVTVVDVRPEQTVLEQDRTYGRSLHARDAATCCALRKVAPLDAALQPYEAWVTGVRRADGPGRRRTKPVEWDQRRQLVKINPIVAWSDEDVRAYVKINNVPVNPLVAQGYPSIGCAPCTRPSATGEDVRAGRWAGTEQTECGLHR